MTLGNQVSNCTVGFGTAALGGNSYEVVTMALEAGFRRFDTAEADWWYDQPNVGRALKDYFSKSGNECGSLEISTKIPPWRLTSVDDIRAHAAASRKELLGFCNYIDVEDTATPFPLDVYYIHAPACWKDWHPRCENAPPTLNLRDAWMAMEAVAGMDFSARRIGLSNVRPGQLLDIIRFAESRLNHGDVYPTPRIPDVLQAYADPLNPADDLRAICEEYGIEFVSYSTLGTQHRNVAQNPILTAPIIQALAEKYGRSVAEVVLSWAIQKNMSVIPRSTKKHHIQELARLLQDPAFLEEEDVRRIDHLDDDEASEL